MGVSTTTSREGFLLHQHGGCVKGKTGWKTGGDLAVSLGGRCAWEGLGGNGREEPESVAGRLPKFWFILALKKAYVLYETHNSIAAAVKSSKRHQNMYSICDLVSIAITHHCKGNISEANKMYRRILSLDPNNIIALNNLGLISSPSEKIELLSHALTLNSEYTDAHFNLAVALEQQNRSADAMEHYAKILQILDNLISQGKFEECIHILKLLIQRFPSNKSVIQNIASAYINLGASHQKQGQFKLAIDSFSQALHYDAKNHIAHENIIFTQNFVEGMDIASQQQERYRWNDAYARHFQQTEYWRSNTYRKIRVGYISGNFRSYAATYAFAPLIFNHNPDQFEVVCYADQQGGDSLTELLMAKATLWREVANKSDEQIAHLIVDDRIDILVDCAGFQKGNRLS